MNAIRILMFIPLVCVFGCGGSKVLKEPEPFVVTRSLATASDQHVSATLDWVNVANGPGIWVEFVDWDWDEYQIRVQNLTDDSIRVTNITVLDSLGTQIEPRENRKQLVKGTKQTKRRYKDEGLKVKAGFSADIHLLLGAAATAGSIWLVPASIAQMMLYPLATATLAYVAAPVLVGAGVIRVNNHRKVDKYIESRQTLPPIVLQEEEEKSLYIFFPMAPSPRQVEITYADSQGDHTLIIDTRTALDGLHLVQADK